MAWPELLKESGTVAYNRLRLRAGGIRNLPALHWAVRPSNTQHESNRLGWCSAHGVAIIPRLWRVRPTHPVHGKASRVPAPNVQLGGEAHSNRMTRPHVHTTKTQRGALLRTLSALGGMLGSWNTPHSNREVDSRVSERGVGQCAGSDACYRLYSALSAVSVRTKIQ